MCGGIAASLGGLSLVGWITGLRVLTSVNVNYIPMAPDTAVLFVGLGLVLVVKTSRPLPNRVRVLASVVIALASVYGLLKLVEYFVKLDLTFENYLFPITDRLGTFPIGRMSPITGGVFFLSGFGLLAVLNPKARYQTQNLAGGAGILVLIAGFIATIGYVFGTPLLYGGDLIPLAVTTAIAFLFLGIELVAAAGPDTVFVRPLVGPSVRAQMLRAFLPLTAIIVLVQAFLREIITEISNVNHALLSAAISLIFLTITALAVSRVAHVISRAIDIAEQERKQVELKLQYLSTHDALTSLYNRVFFEEELARMERSRQRPISVVMIDLNGLKQVNDSQGHAAGDELLRRAARVFKCVFRSEDVVARVGGDEFAVLLPSTDAPTSEVVIERVRKCIGDDGNPPSDPPLSFALGAATVHGHESLAEVLKTADMRMYEDKSAQVKRKNMARS